MAVSKGKSEPSKSKTASPRSSASRSTPAAGAPEREQGAIEVIARGVLLHGGRVLMCVDRKGEYMYLPGGHVEFGESAASATEREFLEECGLSISVGPLLLVQEGSFRTRKRVHHELNLVFHVERGLGTRSRGLRLSKGGERAGRDLESLPPPVKSKEAHLEFRWVDLAAIADLDVRPTAAKAFLATGAGLMTPSALSPADHRWADHGPPGPEWVSTMSELA